MNPGKHVLFTLAGRLVRKSFRERPFREAYKNTQSEIRMRIAYGDVREVEGEAVVWEWSGQSMMSDEDDGENERVLVKILQHYLRETLKDLAKMLPTLLP